MQLFTYNNEWKQALLKILKKKSSNVSKNNAKISENPKSWEYKRYLLKAKLVSISKNCRERQKREWSKHIKDNIVLNLKLYYNVNENLKM